MMYIVQVFTNDQDRPVFFVASRGHHADIGGITPGSMPPHSKSIYEEGAVFKSFFLVKNGVFQEQGMTKCLISSESNPPRIYGNLQTYTRNLLCYLKVVVVCVMTVITLYDLILHKLAWAGRVIIVGSKYDLYHPTPKKLQQSIFLL